MRETKLFCVHLFQIMNRGIQKDPRASQKQLIYFRFLYTSFYLLYHSWCEQKQIVGWICMHIKPHILLLLRN